MIAAPSAKISRLITHEAKLCRRFTQYLHIDDKSDEINVFMGVGFISGRDGLSQGLPIDILNMIIVADQVRKKLAPVKSKIHILIADHLAYHNLSEELLIQAERLAQHYQNQIEVLLQSLGIQDDVILHLSSQIAQKESYQEILQAISLQDTKHLPTYDDKLAVDILSCQGKYNSTHLFYFLSQAALTKYFLSVYRCQIKIGWSKGSTQKAILGTIQYDEPHFDRFYQQVYNPDEMSFIYVDAGHNLENDASEVPYCSPHKGGHHSRILFGQDINTAQLLISPKSPLSRNIALYYEYLTPSNPGKECPLGEKLRFILALVQQRPKQTLILLFEAFEKMSLATEFGLGPTLTPGYLTLRRSDFSQSMEACCGAKEVKQSSKCVLL
jgi:hypothetical protein